MENSGFRVALLLFILATFACQAGAVWAQGLFPSPGKPAIIEFARPSCPVCKAMENILLEVKARSDGRWELRFAFIEPDEYLFKKYRVTLVPTQVFLDAKGREVYRHEGLMSKEDLMKKLRELHFVQD